MYGLLYQLYNKSDNTEENLQKEIYRRNLRKHTFYINRNATDHIYLERNVKFSDAFQRGPKVPEIWGIIWRMLVMHRK